jgi:hypothetical protein
MLAVAAGPKPVPVLPTPTAPPPTPLLPTGINAVEFDTVVAASGLLNVLPRAQRIEMGFDRAGHASRVSADEHGVHILVAGRLIKTVASRLSTQDLHELCEFLKVGARSRASPTYGRRMSTLTTRVWLFGSTQLALTLNAYRPWSPMRTVVSFGCPPA